MHNYNAFHRYTGEKNKNDIISFYNIAKGAFDVIDEVEIGFSTVRISDRYQIVFCIDLLNVAVINARMILMTTNTKSEVIF